MKTFAWVDNVANWGYGKMIEEFSHHLFMAEGGVAGSCRTAG